MTAGGHYDDHELVIVSYHSHQQLEQLLLALPPDVPFVVVDNASGADGVPALVARHPRGRCLDGANSGFARAANLGARTSAAELLVFVNPDTRPTGAVLSALLDDLRRDATLAAVAPLTVDSTGRPELGVAGWEPTVARCLVYAFGVHRFLPASGVYAGRSSRRTDPDWITGACLAVRRSTFLELSGFDERYFVYNEDMALGRALRAAGLRQRLRVDLEVPHAVAGSGGGSLLMPQQRGASMASYLHHNNSRARATTMRLVLAAGIAGRAVAARLRGREHLARKHTAYLRGIVGRRSPFVVPPSTPQA